KSTIVFQQFNVNNGIRVGIVKFTLTYPDSPANGQAPIWLCFLIMVFRWFR
ncbi:MAG: hypothetical protein ACI9J3_002799, partial [Parvicellaceae bacterium]